MCVSQYLTLVCCVVIRLTNTKGRGFKNAASYVGKATTLTGSHWDIRLDDKMNPEFWISFRLTHLSLTQLRVGQCFSFSDIQGRGVELRPKYCGIMMRIGAKRFRFRIIDSENREFWLEFDMGL